MLLRLALALALGALGAAGCVAADAPTGIRDGDPVLFEEEVQPILRGNCAFQGCHGREGMPLTLYALDFLRLRDPEAQVDTSRSTLDERALSETELEHNRMALAARTSERDPDGERVLMRLVPLSEGGIPHGHTVVYPGRDAPDIGVLLRFFRTVHVE